MFSSNDVVIASRLQSNIESNTIRSSLKEKKNFRKIVNLMCMSNSDENQIYPIENDSCRKKRISKENDSSEDRNEKIFKSNCSRILKPGQLIRLRFLSISHVVHGIEDGGLYYRRRRGRDWFRVSARCVSRISNRTLDNRVSLRGQCISSQRSGRCDVQRSSTSGARQLKQLLEGRTCEESKETSVAGKELSRKSIADPLSSNVQSSRKRRVGIVKNQYVAESGDAGLLVCELVRGLERLFDEKNPGNNEVTMKSKKQQNTVEGIVDPIEENETYDEFDTIRMPMVRSLSKSPQSDEGIETDSDRRRGSIARCWSLDSTAASDEDTSLTTHQQKRHKLRVTRCCSSDSAVLSDEDQIKGEGDGIMPPVALSRRTNRGGVSLLKT